jgi:hypothetical protein
MDSYVRDTVWGRWHCGRARVHVGGAGILAMSDLSLETSIICNTPFDLLEDRARID